jgi:glycosyltransferase involved in cell wall biosynthesis
MRVGLIIYGDLDTLSGGYLYDRQLVNFLRQHGDEVHIISLPWSHYGRHLLHNFDANLRHRLRHTPLDILLQDELNHPSLFWLNKRLKRHAPYPLVSIVHHLRCSENHPWPLAPFYRWLEKRYLCTVDGFIFNSKTTRDTVNHLLGQEKPFLVAYPAADHQQPSLTPAAVAQRAKIPGPLRLLFIGNIIPRKGCHTLLQALAKLSTAVWQLNIVGDPTVNPQYAQQLKAQAHTLGIASSIRWHGRLPHADLQQLLNTSHLLVVPSTYEGFGIVYLEGMSHGLPAIATTAGAAHELIRDGENGFLIPPQNAAQLAQRLQALINNRHLLTRLSLSALDSLHHHPTWETSMSRARHFLTTLLPN